MHGERERQHRHETEVDPSWLQRELDEAHRTIRKLLRQISGQQARYEEISRAYSKTVTNLVAVTHENATLERERDLWKLRAAREPAAITVGLGNLELTPAEVSAIRKAMARLHHPDAGGDTERMKRWNAALDPLER